MTPVRFVYFDLDDTLLDHRRAEKMALADVYAQWRAAFGTHTLADVQAIYHKHNVVVWRRYAAGDLTKTEAKRLRFQQLLDACAIQGLVPEAISDFYMDRYSYYWAWSEGAEAAFHAIANHYPVGVLTNGFTEIQRAKLAQFPHMRDRLAALVISEEFGQMKPHPALFAHATAQTDAAPHEILYVGDSYHSDVQGGTGAGWQVAWYTPNANEQEAPQGVFQFDDWTALTERLLG